MLCVITEAGGLYIVRIDKSSDASLLYATVTHSMNFVMVPNERDNLHANSIKPWPASNYSTNGHLIPNDAVGIVASL